MSVDKFAQATQAVLQARRTGIEIPSLADFIEQTVQFKLHTWQRDHLCPLLERFRTEKGLRLLIHGPPQFGKPTSVDCLVLMGDGSQKRLGDIVVGDYVYTHNRRGCRVSAVFEQGHLECVEIATCHGNRPVAALDHPFLTTKGWVDAGHLRVGDVLANVDQAGDASFPYLRSTIVNISPVGLRECRCLTVDDDHTFCVESIVVHNSIIFSKRFPAWLLAQDPYMLMVMAGYNIEHTSQTLVEPVRNLMQSEWYRNNFPKTQIPTICSAQAFSTSVREALNDGQDSVTAVGLLSGFTGKGLTEATTRPDKSITPINDALLIDDPYASPEEAASVATNEKVWRWWNDNARNRVHPNANVGVLFHRYHEDDIAGRLLAEGGWEYIRFPAIADGGQDDPTGRQIGEILSPKWSLGEIQKIEANNPKVFLGQWQGKPRPDEGAFIKREWLVKHNGPIPKLDRWVRFWDLAVSAKNQNDFTAGALVGIGPDHTIYLRNVVKFRAEWPEACETIVSVTSADSIMCQREEADYQVGVERVAWQLPMIQDLFTKAVFQHVPLHPMSPTVGRAKRQVGKKERASGWVARAAFDKFRIITGDWDVQSFIEEALVFDGNGLAHDDQCDATSGAYNMLWHLNGGLIEEEKTLDWNSMEFIDLITGANEGDDWEE